MMYNNRVTSLYSDGEFTIHLKTILANGYTLQSWTQTAIAQHMCCCGLGVVPFFETDERYIEF